MAIYERYPTTTTRKTRASSLTGQRKSLRASVRPSSSTSSLNPLRTIIHNFAKKLHVPLDVPLPLPATATTSGLGIEIQFGKARAVIRAHGRGWRWRREVEKKNTQHSNLGLGRGMRAPRAPPRHHLISFPISRSIDQLQPPRSPSSHFTTQLHGSASASYLLLGSYLPR